jgi:hypothetical protein
MSEFPTFQDVYGTYPKLSSRVTLQTPAKPTNSWIENVLANNTKVDEKKFYAVPWSWVTYTEGDTEQNVGKFFIDHCSTMGVTTTVTQGNILQIQSPPNGIFVYEARKEVCQLVDVSDLCAQFESERMKVYPCRGSAFANFYFQRGDVVLDFQGYPPLEVKVDGEAAIVKSNYAKNSLANYNTFVSSNSTSTTAYFFDSYERNERVDVTTTTSDSKDVVSLLKTTVSSLSRTWTVNNVTGQISGSPYDNFVINSSGFTLVILVGNVTYSITVVLMKAVEKTPANVLVTTSKSVPKETLWYLFGPRLERNGNVFTSENYTGPLQIANAEQGIEIYKKYSGRFPVSITVGDFTEGGGFTVESEVDGDFLMFLPSHWNEYETNLKREFLSITNLMYGKLTATAIGKKVVIGSNFIFPSIVPQTGFSEQVKVDITNSLPNSALTGPYQYGQDSFHLARLLMYAKWNEVDYGELLKVLVDYALLWLTGKNLLPNGQDNFVLQREPYWGGTIVPADYLVRNDPETYKNGNYDNSYYNDHHFHWGYMFYTWNAILQENDSLLPYKSKIEELLRDVVNPTTTSSGWKTRYKDWYSGHGFATGLTGDSQRKQESASEAIHCYYSAYLLSKTLDFDDLARSSAACLVSEIHSLKHYYFLLAEGSRLGLMKEVAGIGMMLVDSKQATLDWSPDPNTHNGRMLGVYGIQAIPFTEVTQLQLPSEWLENAQTCHESFRVTEDLVSNLIINNQYTPKFYTNEKDIDPPFDPYKTGTFWGAVGAKLLSYSSLSNVSSQAIISAMQVKQRTVPNLTLQYDSVSHTIFILKTNGKLGTFGRNSLVVHPAVPISCFVRVPLIEITAKFSEETKLQKLLFKVIDDMFYCNQLACPTCDECEKVVRKDKLKVSKFSTCLDPLFLIDAPGRTYQEKALNLPGTSAGKLLLYSSLKLILARLMRGKFDLKYLRQRYNGVFFARLRKTDFRNFIELFETVLPNYNEYFLY